MNVPIITIVYAILLILLGIIGYATSAGASLTAFIPTGFGIILLALGLLARKGKSRMQAMHAATLLGLIGFIATVGSSSGMVTILTGGHVERAGAVIAKSIMSILSLAYVIVCLLSFIIARVNRSESSPQS